MKNIKFLTPLIPAIVAVYLVINQYLYYVSILIAKLKDLGLNTFTVSLVDGSPDILKLYLQYTYLFLGFSLVFIALTLLNTYLFKKEWLFNFWAIYVVVAIFAVFSITTHFTTIKYGVISYEELLRKDNLINKLMSK